MFAELLRSRLAGIIELSPDQIRALEAHYELLLRWNKTLNLTRISDLEEAVERHYCESLFLASKLGKVPLRIVDVGSGAGFPGFPVAIVRPDCDVTLVESHQRKAVFLKEASRGAKNIHVIAKRADDLEERFHVLISRAVSYDDLAPVKDLAPLVVLLTGADEPPGTWELKWPNPVMLPWGRQRFLRIGSA